jgi:hypothetical protein
MIGPAQPDTSLAVELRSYLSSIVAREILAAYEGKKVARTGLRPLQLRKLLKTAREFGLAIEISDSVVYSRKDRGKGGWSNSFSSTPHGRFGDRLVYVASSDKLAKAARHAEEVGNDHDFGGHLRIPQCCRLFYEKHAADAARYQNDFFPFFSDQQFTARPTALLNLAGQYFDASLVSHFPCSPDCSGSIEIAKENARMIARYDHSWLNQILDILNRAAIYTEYSGVFMLRTRQSKGTEIVYYQNRDIIGTSTGRVANALAAGDGVRIASECELQILRKEAQVARVRAINLRAYIPTPCSVRDILS